jgi:hypothetical protein
MKHCTYCGKEYPDDVEVCQIDGQTLQLVGARAPERQPSEVKSSWNKDMSDEVVGKAGRWLIFAGIPSAIVAFFFVVGADGHALEHAVSGKLLPYILFFTPVAVVLGSRVIYDYFPRHLVFPFGIAGWIITFILLFWFFWFGPGVLKV